MKIPFTEWKSSEWNRTIIELQGKMVANVDKEVYRLRDDSSARPRNTSAHLLTGFRTAGLNWLHSYWCEWPDSYEMLVHIKFHFLAKFFVVPQNCSLG